jgi:hypothetical protein
MKGNAKGGKRPGAGRKPGAPNKRTEATIIRAEAGGIMPLDIMLNVMRRSYNRALKAEKSGDEGGANEFFAVAQEQATAAAPYLHPRLKSIEHEHKPVDLSNLTNEQLKALAEFKRLTSQLTP